eukprot:CAMPEP_0185256058 /NCGR_PEP_ID=MMETSP1359-20130426/5134_1 /TAXON_ID=552665 /ORGANISM="Bigelowiella longifila, Strain CCMP242" /LENGTH=126 /DNA_ID=CAMNT_0027840383 /DNA_START=204 /DNA_END=581 /DNA_ORIENTATION=+
MTERRGFTNRDSRHDPNDTIPANPSSYSKAPKKLKDVASLIMVKSRTARYKRAGRGLRDSSIQIPTIESTKFDPKKDSPNFGDSMEQINKHVCVNTTTRRSMLCSAGVGRGGTSPEFPHARAVLSV